MCPAVVAPLSPGTSLGTSRNVASNQAPKRTQPSLSSLLLSARPQRFTLLSKLRLLIATSANTSFANDNTSGQRSIVMAVPSSLAKEEEQPNRLNLRLLMHSYSLQICDHFLHKHHFPKNALKTRIHGARTSA